tara:strand:- start:2203 stop:2475 length:273 start_codon:yes stop_codon:yes gene_type:complete
MEIFLIIILSLIIFGCSYVIWNLNSKVTTYEAQIEEYQEWIDSFTETVEDVDDKLKQIDNNGTFEADDEVGTFFQTLKILMGQITEYWEK